MKLFRLLALAAAGLFLTSTVHAGYYADAVIGYNSGTGFSSGYTDPSTALGEPSRVTPGAFGGPVTPFDPAYLSGQMVSVGAGGFLTLQFNTAIQNRAGNPFGIDFIVFGNSFFNVTNEYDEFFNIIGTARTDGLVVGNNTGATRVSVSQDGVTYYQLNLSLAPTVDGLHPTDGSGDFQKAVNPALTEANFNGLDLAGVRALYAGSGGGTGFDIAWAQDGNGQSVNLSSANFLRIDVDSGKSEIDGVAAVPEPATWMLLVAGFGALGMMRRRR